MGLLGLAFASWPVGSARASNNEAHLVRDEVRVVLSPDGRSEVTHAEQWHVTSGALHFFDVVGLEEHADLRPSVTVEGTDGTRTTAHLAWFAPRVARVTLDDPHGLRRGDYRATLSYGVDLLASHELGADGSMWRLAWTAPAIPEGIDSETVSFDLPAAPTAPRADMGGSNGDDGVVAGVERGAARDRLQLVRPHVARGEAITWAIRLDARALSHGVEASPVEQARRAAANAEELSSTERTWRRALEGLALATVAALYGWTARRRRGRGLVPLSPRLRGLASGVALGLGLALQAAGSMTAGAIALAACIIVATLAPSPRPEGVRGPGSWIELSPIEAFARPKRAREQLRQLFAAITALLVLALAALGATLPSLSRPLAIGALDLLVLVPLLVGGGLAASAFSRHRRPLARAFRALSRRTRHQPLVVVPLARVATRTKAGRGECEELRLRLAPEPGMQIQGTVGVELGLVSSPAAAARPEILVRVLSTSCASARITALAPWAAALPGLHAGERVIRLSPRWPSLRLARQLAERVTLALVDRRDALHAASAATDSWSGPDRRSPTISPEPSTSVATLSPLSPAQMAPSRPAPDASFLLLR